MRSTSDGNKTICLFVDDLPDGSCLVWTPDGEISTKDINGSEPFYLKNGEEIFWPDWVDW